MKSEIIKTNNHPPELLLNLGVSAIYFLFAYFSLDLSFANTNATPVWPPSGLSLAAILLFGNRVLPGIFIGAFAVNYIGFLETEVILPSTAALVSLFIGIGNSLEAYAGRILLKRMLKGNDLSRFYLTVSGVICFVCTAITISFIAAFVGSTSLFFGGVFDSDQFPIVALTWWTGDTSGILLFTPLLLVWFPPHMKEIPILRRGSIVEGILLFMAIIFMSGLVFQLWFSTSFFFTRAFLIIPFLIWAAMRFNLTVVVVAVLACAFIALYGTLDRQGPFVTGSLNASLLTVEAFIATNAVMVLLLNAAIREQKLSQLHLKFSRDELEKQVQLRTLQLAVTNEQLEEAQRLARIGSWEWNIRENRISWSDELYQIYGVDKKDFKPEYENFLPLVHEDDRPVLDKNVKATLETGGLFDFFHRIVRPDGKIRILHARGERVKDESGRIVMLRGTGQDVTEEKLAQEMLLQTSRQLEEKNRELEKSNRELASFSYVASHDLQEPLRKIQIFSDRILQSEEKLSEKGRQTFERMVSSAGHMKQLITDLLAYSQVSSERPRAVEADLNDIVNEVIRAMQELIEEKQAKIEVGELPTLRVIRFQVNQLFSNLLSNSLKFSRKGVQPQISIRAQKVSHDDRPQQIPEPGKSYWEISFRDNGIGFDDEYSEKVFEIFQRLHGNSSYEGKGIGLAICKKIMDNHNGMIRGTGVVNSGAEFRLYFPIEIER